MRESIAWHGGGLPTQAEDIALGCSPVLVGGVSVQMPHSCHIWELG